MRAPMGDSSEQGPASPGRAATPQALLGTIDPIVADAIAACASQWPDVKVGDALVRERLRGVDLDTLDRTHLGELCLAWACLTGDAAAQRAIDVMIRAEAKRAVGELRAEDWLVDEVHQELGQRLLVAADGATPRLATYAGQAALGRWLGVAAKRTALNLTRRRRRFPREEPVERDTTELAAVIVDPDLAVVRERYRDDVMAAIRAAFGALERPRDRNLLRLYYLERVSLDKLGQMFGVNASTVSRWLAALRETILEDTRDRLAERLGFAGQAHDLDSLVRAVQSDLDVSLTRILKPPE